MPQRRVYLGQIDIRPDGKLDLQAPPGLALDDYLIKYLFMYGLLADEVYMQGSAPLKSTAVFHAYQKLSEAFTRNESHALMPIYAFVLSDEAEDYESYIVQRLDSLQGQGEANAERQAYLKNDGVNVSKRIDADLSFVDIPRRTRSVSKSYRKGLVKTLQIDSESTSAVSHETAEIALRRIDSMENIQTFYLLGTLGLRDRHQLLAMYKLARKKYRQANAFGCEAINSEDSPLFIPRNITRFIHAIGLMPYLDVSRNLSANALFKLRQIPSIQLLKNEYYMCQSDADIDELINIITMLRLNGRIRSAVKHSPAALVALIFEGLSQANIGNKAINKGAEVLTKVMFENAVDEHFAKRCYRLFALIEQFNQELKAIATSDRGVLAVA
jgi:hypothetical protein